MLVAPRIVNDVSYVTDINHECHFSWQRLRSAKSKLAERAGAR